MVNRLVAVDDADYRLPQPVRQAIVTDLRASYVPLPESESNALTGWFHADGFGAVGDDETSNDDALAAALAAAHGGSVYLPRGIYRVTQATRLLLEGNFTSIIGDPAGRTEIKFTHPDGGLDVGNGTDFVYENRLRDILITGAGATRTLVRMRKVYEPYFVNTRIEGASAQTGSCLIEANECGQLDADRLILANAPIGIKVTGTTTPISTIRLGNFYNLGECVRFAGSGCSKFVINDSWIEACAAVYTIDSTVAVSFGELVLDNVRVLNVANQRLLTLTAAPSFNAQAISFRNTYVDAVSSTVPLIDATAVNVTSGPVNISIRDVVVLTASTGPMVKVHPSQAWHLFRTNIQNVRGVPAEQWSAAPLTSGGTWATPTMLDGVGTPEGQVAAPVGSLYRRADAFVGFSPSLYLKMADASSKAWRAVGTQRAVATKTSNYALTLDDEVTISNGSNLTITLPQAALYHGRFWTIKNVHSTACTVVSAGGTIDGASTASLAQWKSGTFISDGTNWVAI